MDAYRLVRLREGYEAPQDSEWNWIRWMRWVCTFIPKKVQDILMMRNKKKAKKLAKADAEEIDEEEKVDESG